MKFLTTLSVALLALTAWAVPECVVLQVAPQKAEAEVWIADDLGSFLDEEGRVTPIVWTEADALFRQMNGRSKRKYPSRAGEKEGLSFCAEHRVPYLLVVTAAQSDQGLLLAAKMYHSGSQVWTYGDTQKVSGNGSTTSAVLSAARTIAILAGEGPLKSLTARAKLPTPNPEKGTGPTPGPNPAHEVRPELAADVTREAAQKLLDSGRYAEAILLLRDLVDRYPLDPQVRSDHVHALLVSHEFAAAATASESAAQLVRPSAPLYLLASRAYLRLGKADQAQEALRQALAREGDGHLAALLRGEIALLKGDAPNALAAFDLALKTKDSADAHLGRALALALAGQPEAAEAEWATLPKFSAYEATEVYERLILLLDQAWNRVIERVRQSMASPIQGKPNPKNIEFAVVTANIAAGLDAAVRHLPVPPRYLASQEKRELAQKLLLQAASDAIALVQRGDEDLINDIAISLGDAIRRYKGVQAEYELEQIERDDRSFPSTTRNDGSVSRQ